MRLPIVLTSFVFTLFVAVPWVDAAGPPTMITDINPTDSCEPDHLMAAGTVVYLVADDGVHGRELWRTDGTAAGTWLVVDALPGSRSSNPEPMAAVGNVLYFNTKDGVHGRELWRTDGTPSGTRMVKNITAGSGSTDFWESIALGNKLLFDANGSLYVTDGTAAGTRHVGPVGLRFVTFHGRAYYLSGSNVDFHIWKTDGTAAGTKLVSWSPPGVSFLAATSDRLFMLTNAEEFPSGPPTLWVSDGTKAVTHPLTVDGQLQHPNSLRAAGDRAYVLDQRGDEVDLWRSNGTGDGTKVLKTVAGNARELFVSGNRALLPVNTSGTTWDLWKSNGTIRGTREIGSFTASYSPEEMVSLGTQIFFYSVDNDSDSWTLWRTDGSPGGMFEVMTQTNANTAPYLLTPAGANLIFTADDGVNGRELWSYTP